MKLSPKQIAELLEIADRYTLTFLARTVGTSVLTDSEKRTLRSAGFDLSRYPLNSVDKAFKFGILSNALDQKVVKNMTYSQFKEYFKSGRHIALNNTERLILDALRNQTASDVRKMGSKMKDDIRDAFVRTSSGQVQHTPLVTDAVAQAVKDRKGLKEVVSILGEKTGQWERDLGRIADTSLHHAFNEGRAAQIARTPEKKVYFDVYPGACKHCIKHYLTGGVGSEPKLFTIPQLRANGTNVGRKADQWKAVIGGMHPYCRCTLNEYPEGYKWNPSTGDFSTPMTEEERPRKVKRRSAVTVTVNGKSTVI